MPDYLEVSADILSLTTENLIGGSNTPTEIKLGRLREQQKKGAQTCVSWRAIWADSTSARCPS